MTLSVVIALKPHSARWVLAASAAAIASSMLLSACTSTTQSVDRAAAAASAADASTAPTSGDDAVVLGSERWPSRVECDPQSSWTKTMNVANLTSTSLTLLAGDIDCYDWSGVSTPATVLTNQQVNAGFTETYRLEPSTGSDRNWTMGLNANGTELDGTFRLRIQPGGQLSLAGDTERWEPCRRVKVGADPMATASVNKPSISVDTIWLVSDGSDIYAAYCIGNIGMP